MRRLPSGREYQPWVRGVGTARFEFICYDIAESQEEDGETLKLSERVVKVEEKMSRRVRGEGKGSKIVAPASLHTPAHNPQQAQYHSSLRLSAASSIAIRPSDSEYSKDRLMNFGFAPLGSGCSTLLWLPGAYCTRVGGGSSLSNLVAYYMEEAGVSSLPGLIQWRAY